MRAVSGSRFGRLAIGMCCLAVVACGRTQPPAAALQIETLQLTEGQTLGAGRDADPLTPGFQLEVVIRVTDVKGAEVPLSVATLSWAKRAEGDDSAPENGTIDGAKAHFPRLTLEAGEVTLRIHVKEKDGTRVQTLERNVNLTFDESRPTVVSWSLPSDANGDGTLNLAELGGAAAVLQIDAEGAEGGQVLVRERETQRELGTSTISGDGVSLSLTGLERAVERTVAFEIVVTNALGNQNDLAQNPEAVGTFALDGIAPTVTLLAPTQVIFGLADDADPATAGYQLRVRARTTAEVGAESLVFTLGGQSVAATPVEQEAQVDFTIPANSEQAHALSVVATDAAGNASAPATKSVTVDLVAPQFTAIASPVANTTYVQTELGFDVTVSGAEGRPVKVFRKVGAQSTQMGALTVTGGKAVGSLSFANGTFDVTFEVSDAAGNPAVASVSSVSVINPGCAISIVTPSSRPKQYLLADDQNPAVAGLQTTLVGSSVSCAGLPVSLSRNGGAVEATTTVEGNGSFSFPVTLADGEASRLTVAVTNAAQVVTNDFVDVTVDLTPATIGAVSPDAPSLFFVAPTNVHLGQPGYVVDAVAGGDAQAQLSATVSDAAGGNVVAVYQGSAVSLVHEITSSPEVVNVPVELAHGTSGTLTLEVRDASGNVTTHAFAAVVDVRPPATPVVSANITHARRATVDVSWTASGDDDTTGAVAGYDFRYSTDAVLEFGIQTEADFFGSDGAAPTSKRVGTGLLPAETLTRTLTLPPIAKYSLQVRAVDEVGNYSPLIATPLVNNASSDIVLANPGTGTRFGIRMATGDFDGDGVKDLAVGDDSSAQSVYFFRGGPTLGTVPAWITLSSTEAGNFGTSPAAGNVDGNTTADDFLMGSSTWSGSRGRAFLYFGRQGVGIVSTDRIEFRGASTMASLFGSHISIVPDLNNDQIDEVAIAASGGPAGQVYLFLGRSESEWLALATSSENGGASYFIPASAADLVFTGPPPPTPSTLTRFGRNSVIEAVGDLNGDGHSEFAIGATRTTMNMMYVYNGSDVFQRSQPGSLNRVMATSDAIHSFQGSAPDGSIDGGFGYQLIGGSHVVGDSLPDLIISEPFWSRLHVYQGQANGTLQLSGVIQAPDELSNYFGNAVAGGDINGDGFTDLVVGGNPSSGTTSAWILYHSGDVASPYDLRLPGFNVSRHRGQTRTRGLAVGVGDITGDGTPDVIASDSREGTGKIYVRY